MDTPAAVTALAALAQPHRLAVFRRLVELGPEGAFAGELAGHLAIPANTLSFHLKALQQAGLIAPEPRGRHIRYRADFAAMRALVGFLTDNCCGGDAALCAPAEAPAKAADCC
jgi:DNA-binding transcriptional ArsR family regulator